MVKIIPTETYDQTSISKSWYFKRVNAIIKSNTVCQNLKPKYQEATFGTTSNLNK